MSDSLCNSSVCVNPQLVLCSRLSKSFRRRHSPRLCYPFSIDDQRRKTSLSGEARCSVARCFTSYKLYPALRRVLLFPVEIFNQRSPRVFYKYVLSAHVPWVRFFGSRLYATVANELFTFIGPREIPSTFVSFSSIRHLWPFSPTLCPRFRNAARSYFPLAFQSGDVRASSDRSLWYRALSFVSFIG